MILVLISSIFEPNSRLLQLATARERWLVEIGEVVQDTQYLDTEEGRTAQPAQTQIKQTNPSAENKVENSFLIYISTSDTNQNCNWYSQVLIPGWILFKTLGLHSTFLILCQDRINAFYIHTTHNSLLFMLFLCNIQLRGFWVLNLLWTDKQETIPPPPPLDARPVPPRSPVFLLWAKKAASPNSWERSDTQTINMPSVSIRTLLILNHFAYKTVGNWEYVFNQMFLSMFIFSRVSVLQDAIKNSLFWATFLSLCLCISFAVLLFSNYRVLGIWKIC